jgi:hypothetical protein
MHRRLVTALGASLLLLAALLPTATAAQPVARNGAHQFTKAGIFIVEMRDLPVVAYDGSIKGLAATKPAKGQKIDPNSAVVTRYVGYLDGRHDAELKGVGAATTKKLYDYAYSYNGFAARLSAAQANKLAADKDIVAVSPAETRKADTSSTPTFLGLTAPGGLWDQLGGFQHAGEDIIIGDVDSGIWPESLSFTDRVDGSGTPSSDPSAKLAYQQIPGWHGKCVPGEAFNASMCNQKLIGAKWFNASQGGNAGIDANNPWEFNSVRLQRPAPTRRRRLAATTASRQPAPPDLRSISGMAPAPGSPPALWSTNASTAGSSARSLSRR